jgi:hypothetical protein
MGGPGSGRKPGSGKGKGVAHQNYKRANTTEKLKTTWRKTTVAKFSKMGKKKFSNTTFKRRMSL